jgi:AcrR family transcriptional regulator
VIVPRVTEGQPLDHEQDQEIRDGIDDQVEHDERRHLVSGLASIPPSGLICQGTFTDSLGVIADPPSTERRYGGQSAPERRAQRRERLLAAGLDLFGSDGYAATTIEGLCTAASLNARYFYEQFRNREELLGAVYERHVAAVLERVQAAIAHAPAGRERLEAGLRAFVDGTLADERGARVNYFEMVGVSPALEARRRAVLRQYAELIAAEAGALPAPPAADARMTAVALVGATDGLIIDWLSGDRRADREALVDTLLAIYAPVVG